MEYEPGGLEGNFGDLTLKLWNYNQQIQYLGTTGGLSRIVEKDTLKATHGIIMAQGY
jgi:hypothetical protein